MTRQYRFGNWLFDADTHRLFDGEADITLEPRVARLLEFLLTHPQEMLSHDCLIEAVWDGRVVSDEAVRRAMSALRHALTRDGSDRCIQTVYKKGYIASLMAEPLRTAAPPNDNRTAIMALPAGPQRPAPARRQQLVQILIGATYLLLAATVLIALGHAMLLSRF